MSEQWEEASVQYNDFKGTAAADDADVQQPNLYELAGISEDEWWIVGLELSGSYEYSSGSVLAVSKSGAWGAEEVERRAGAGQALPVTRFELPDDDAGVQALRRLKRWSVHVLSRTVLGYGAELAIEDAPPTR